MTSFIITSQDLARAEQEAQKMCSERQIGQFDITLLKRDLEGKNPKQSLGIEDVRNMQQKLFLKPLKSPQKAVIIQEAQLLTIEAQNALLKVLEEPPADTIILLLANSKDSLLPTIRSRCQIIELKDSQKELSEEKRKEYEQFFTHSLSISQSLYQAQILSKNKETAITWLEEFMLVLREKLLSQYIPQENTSHEQTASARYISLLKSAQKTQKIVKTTNANLRLTLEVFFLSF